MVLMLSMPLMVMANTANPNLDFKSGTLEGWTAEPPNTWSLEYAPSINVYPDDPPRWVISSLTNGEENTGTLRSSPFKITSPVQTFGVGGWDGGTDRNNGDRNYVLLKSYPDGEVLRRTHTPGGNRLAPIKWIVTDLIGREVYLEIIDNHTANGFAWIAFADYTQQEFNFKDPIDVSDLYSLSIDKGAVPILCRTMPFSMAHPWRRGETTRKALPQIGEEIPINNSMEVMYLLGMVNSGWEYGTSHWGGHPELTEKRSDQTFVGLEVGTLEVHYEDGTIDNVPLEIGATIWYFEQWANGPSHGVNSFVQEPFQSRPEMLELLNKSLRLHRSEDRGSDENHYAYYYLALSPKPKPIKSLIIVDSPDVLGTPLVSAITFKNPAKTDGLESLGALKLEKEDLTVNFDLSAPIDWSRDVTALAQALYTHETDLPKIVEPLAFPAGLDATKIDFIGPTPLAPMLNNVWVQNLVQMDGKFEPDTGYFHESGKKTPWYGGYSGIGTWMELGVYYEGAFGRCSDHYATLAMRCLLNSERWTSYVDFCDKWLYFYRKNHDPAQGPANDHLDIDAIPEGMPPHWGFVVNGPGGVPWQLNEIPGDEETDGHGATIVGRWSAWRWLGAPSGDWLMAPRADVYGKSRWDSTRDAANFICWLMDYTGRDVMWCEGETVGWGGGPHLPLMASAEDRAKVKDSLADRVKCYANANMYEPYPTWVCATALRCAAQMAEAANAPDDAKRWRQYADRLQRGMIRDLTEGDHVNTVWRVAPSSTYPSLQDSLVHAWFAFYFDGYDSKRWDPVMTPISRNTLKRQLAQRPGTAPVLAMGYGQGWLTKSALLLDDMDSASPLLLNIARYSYDKNMDYVDKERGIDWREYLWLIPEGTNILPDGSWHRIGDLTNGANQGPAMHAIEMCAGVDDTRPADLKLMPRVPDPLTGIYVQNFQMLIPSNQPGFGLTSSKINYSFVKNESLRLTSSIPLPKLSIRVGPYADQKDAQKVMELLKETQIPDTAKARIESLGTYQQKDAWWVWVEDLENVDILEWRLNE